MPEGLLTPVQHRLLRIIQAAGREGISIAEIWKQFRAKQKVSRTTVLKLVERLETREWLIRAPNQKPVRYISRISPNRSSLIMLQHFVDEYYGGIAANLIDDLLKFKCISGEEQIHLRHRLSTGCGSPRCRICAPGS